MSGRFANRRDAVRCNGSAGRRGNNTNGNGKFLGEVRVQVTIQIKTQIQVKIARLPAVR